MTKPERGPNPLVAGWSMLRAQLRRAPRPQGTGTFDHAALAPILETLGSEGVAALPRLRPDIAAYRRQLEMVAPDSLTRSEAVAFWLNLYNAGALELAAEARQRSVHTVLRIPGAFRRPWTTIDGEALSLDDIEHGKVRRLRDPRIHSALVCGSASCPTLRYEPYVGARVDAQLDDQMRSFLRAGGAVADRTTRTVRLNRIFLWYGADFARPHRMPSWLPAGKWKVLASVLPWLEDEVVRWVEAERPRIAFQPYDWALACTVR